MTQYEFDTLPLLLRPQQALMVLAGVRRDDFYAMRRDGDLRTFQPNPGHLFAYYYKIDVGRAAGLKLKTDHILTLPDPVDETRFMLVSGLSELAILQALASRQLRNVGRNGSRWFPRADLSAWMLTAEPKQRVNATGGAASRAPVTP